MVGTLSLKPKSDYITKTEEIKLILGVQKGSDWAFRQLIKRFDWLIHLRSQHYTDPSVDKEALKAAGQLAVYKAARRFDVSTGYRFATYLKPALNTHLTERYCSEKGISPEHSRRLSQLSRATTKLMEDLRREPTELELMEETGLSALQIANAKKSRDVHVALSLDAPLNEDSDLTLLESQADASRDIWSSLETQDMLNVLGLLEANGSIKKRQIDAFLLKSHGYSAKQIGTTMNVGPERVRQILKSLARTVSDHLNGLIEIVCDTPARLISLDPAFISAIPAPVKVRIPLLKRIDATRLGGRICKRIKTALGPVTQKIHKSMAPCNHASSGVLARQSIFFLASAVCCHVSRFIADYSMLQMLRQAFIRSCLNVSSPKPNEDIKHVQTKNNIVGFNRGGPDRSIRYTSESESYIPGDRSRIPKSAKTQSLERLRSFPRFLPEWIPGFKGLPKQHHSTAGDLSIRQRQSAVGCQVATGQYSERGDVGFEGRGSDRSRGHGASRSKILTVSRC